jgi:hypothetical protein
MLAEVVVEVETVVLTDAPATGSVGLGVAGVVV